MLEKDTISTMTLQTNQSPGDSYFGSPTEEIILGTSFAQVKKILGDPIEEITDGNYTVLQYKSNTPVYAHFLTFEDKQLVHKSIGTYKSSKTLGEYVEKYGYPETSIKRHTADEQDSFNLIVHLWPDQGIAVTSSGSTADSSIFNIEEFNATTITQYLSTDGKKFAKNERVELSGVFITTLGISQETQTSSPITYIKNIFTGNVSIMIVLFVLISIILAVILSLWKRKNINR